jgi:hypothetical protein
MRQQAVVSKKQPRSCLQRCRSNWLGAGLPGEVPTLEEYPGTWLEYVELRRAPRTVSRYRNLVGKINKQLGRKPID